MKPVISRIVGSIRRNPRYAGLPLLALIVGLIAHSSVYVETTVGHLPYLGLDLSSSLVPLLGWMAGIGALLSLLGLVVLFVGTFESDAGERSNGNERSG